MIETAIVDHHGRPVVECTSSTNEMAGFTKKSDIGDPAGLAVETAVVTASAAETDPTPVESTWLAAFAASAALSIAVLGTGIAAGAGAWIISGDGPGATADESRAAFCEASGCGLTGAEGCGVVPGPVVCCESGDDEDHGHSDRCRTVAMCGG